MALLIEYVRINGANKNYLRERRTRNHSIYRTTYRDSRVSKAVENRIGKVETERIFQLGISIRADGRESERVKSKAETEASKVHSSSENI